MVNKKIINTVADFQGKKKTFTLSELLVVTAILAFAISSMLLLFITCKVLDQANSNKILATDHAEFILEDIVGYINQSSSTLSSLQDKINAGDWNWDATRISTETASLIDSSERIETIPNPVTDPVTDPLEIFVNVYWKDSAQSNERNIVLKTLITKQ